MAKSLTICYFAAFREHAGIARETVELDVDTTADVFAALAHRHGSSESLGHCKVALNDELADWDAPVADGDTILLFPPVAGG